MRFLDRLCCTLLGLTLSAAGLLLLVDPFATASHLYCGLIPAILLSAVIMIAGIGMLCGLRRKTLSIVALVPTAVALVVSLLSGHIRLTGLCLILLPMAIYHLVYSWREGNGRAPAWFDCAALGVFALCALAIPLDAWINLPRMEFSPLKVGHDLRAHPFKTEEGVLNSEEGPAVVTIPYYKGRLCALLIADDHIIAKVPARRANSPRFQKKLQGDPDRVMADGIVAGRLYVAALAALFALLACVCAILKRHFLKEQPL